MQKKITSHLLKGLIISIIPMILNLVGSDSNANPPQWLPWVSMSVLILGIILSCILFSNQQNNEVTFGNTFAHGFKTGAVTTCLMIIFTIIFLAMHPELKQLALNSAREKMTRENKFSDAEVEQAVAIAGKSFMIVVISSIVIQYLIVSVIASLIGAAIAKKKPSSALAQQP
jgi:hypothetical protein